MQTTRYLRIYILFGCLLLVIAGACSSESAAGHGSTGGTSSGLCQTNAECTDPAAPICDPATHQCKGCNPPAGCPAGQFCDATSGQCQAGCNGDADCPSATPYCTPAHQCVACTGDAQCPEGQVCAAGQCATGCSASKPCDSGQTCCGSTCHDTKTDPAHCGACAEPCPNVPNADVTCSQGQCAILGCAPGFLDCNGEQDDGCEQNETLDGPCTCTPGDKQACYTGPPGSENIGECKGGERTCAPNGNAWGLCIGQTLPIMDICANGLDEDCDGTADNATDLDGDGWTTCDGDCCELFSQCSKPTAVNPGAYEFPGNTVDDDCDASTPDTDPPACSTGAIFTAVTPDEIAKAIELCQFTTETATGPQKKWGVISAEFLLANGSPPTAAQMTTITNQQAAVLQKYGNGGIVPKKGPTMAGMSSGIMRDQDGPNYGGYGTSLGYYSQPPAAYLAAHGGAFPSSAGCSGTCPSGSGANDPVNVRLKIRVPTNALSLSYQFRFFSAEYWTYQCTSFNDFYLALLSSGAPAIPADKNISFDALNNPVSVNNGFFEVCTPKGCNACPGGTGELNGTGLISTGGGTAWLTTQAPVVPGEIITIEFMIFDVSDDWLDSIAILDNFAWSVDPSGVTTHK